jgi:predicted component of type VI protein secretion system
MSARLVPLTPGSAPAIPVQRPVVLIGRHPECDVRLDLPKISRRHCCVAQVYDRLMIRDLGSRNGLRVNGRLVEEIQLRGGDELAIGPLLYRVEVDAPAAALPAPSPAPRPLESPPPVVATKPPSLPSMPLRGDDSGDLIPMDF